jgi:hypothetical protein
MTKDPEEKESGGTETSKKKPSIHMVLYDKKTVRSKEAASYRVAVPEPGTELWTDVVASDIDRFLSDVSICPVAGDHFIIDEDKRTVFQIPFLVRDSTQMHYLYVVCEGTDRITTIRQASWPRGPVEQTLSFIGDIVDEETDEGKIAIPNFRDFIFIAILGACADEFISTLNATRKKVNSIYKQLTGMKEPMAAHAGIYDVHTFLSETFGTAVFLFREFVSQVVKGSGKHLKTASYQHCIEKVENDVKQAIAMRESLENSLELISNTVRASLSDLNIANTERLSRAVEILTRLSVLLMIPNSVFTLWPTMPIDNSDSFLGLPSVGWELILAGVLTVMGQVLISYYYKHSFLKTLLARSDGTGQQGNGPAPPSQQT